jgi:beta-lactam-binding protein with PASTA domain
LTVTAAAGTARVVAARPCVPANLKGPPAKTLKKLLPALSCKVGKIKTMTSKKVAKGDVISLTPGSGSHAADTKVSLTVSSGKPKSKPQKKH